MSRLTGFSPELLRAWELRHQLLAPTRGTGGQRLYSDKDVALLQAVRGLLAEGRSIGEIATMGRRQLLDAHRHGAATTTPGGEPAVPHDAAAAVPLPPVWPTNGRHDVGAARALQIASTAVSRLSARLDPVQLLELIVETLASDFQAALARVWVLDPGGSTLSLRASAGLSRQTARSSRARIDLRTYRFKVGVVARSGEPFVSNGIVGDADFDQRWVYKERLASVAVLPLLADDTLLGVMAAFFRVALTDDVTGALKMFSAVAASSLAAHGATAGGARLAASPRRRAPLRREPPVPVERSRPLTGP